MNKNKNKKVKFLFSQFFVATKGFMKTFKAFIKPFEALQRSVKMEIQLFFLFGIGTRRVKIKKDKNKYGPEYLSIGTLHAVTVERTKHCN